MTCRGIVSPPKGQGVEKRIAASGSCRAEPAASGTRGAREGRGHPRSTSPCLGAGPKSAGETRQLPLAASQSFLHTPSLRGGEKKGNLRCTAGSFLACRRHTGVGAGPGGAGQPGSLHLAASRCLLHPPVRKGEKGKGRCADRHPSLALHHWPPLAITGHSCGTWPRDGSLGCPCRPGSPGGTALLTDSCAARTMARRHPPALWS